MEKFAKARPYLFWSTTDYRALSAAVILENTLNYGEWADVMAVFKILGLKKAAAIFREQTTGERVNYRPKTLNYFKLYFKEYA
jgi:hypothetical protein